MKKSEFRSVTSGQYQNSVCLWMSYKHLYTYIFFYVAPMHQAKILSQTDKYASLRKWNFERATPV